VSRFLDRTTVMLDPLGLKTGQAGGGRIHVVEVPAA
jgi:hypothetical protein